ncbi:unnamed protein product [Protopolystoma xenopodis]|uniref:Uncharacterized protein n=1 Tax=Protopolystoma xenopodis TaxID=117903 RepID=A0A3S5C0L7_9PLAT|nr:unnamed protein product [Protopolystoma xenopodis]
MLDMRYRFTSTSITQLVPPPNIFLLYVHSPRLYYDTEDFGRNTFAPRGRNNKAHARPKQSNVVSIVASSRVCASESLLSS